MSKVMEQHLHMEGNTEKREYTTLALNIESLVNIRYWPSIIIVWAEAQGRLDKSAGKL